MSPITELIGSAKAYGWGLVLDVPMFGYVAGGFTAASGKVSTIRKMPTETETFTSISATLSVAKDGQPTPLCNSGVAGYVCGGFNPSNVTVNTIEKLALTTDTISTLGATLSTSRMFGAGMSNTGTAGYMGSGIFSGGSAIDKIAFSNDSRSTLGATMAEADGSGYNGCSGVQNKGSAGYAILRDSTSIQKLNFSNETRGFLGNSRASATYGPLGASNEGIAGYIASGFSTTNNGNTPYLRYGTGTDKINFSNETTSFISNTVTSNGTGERQGGYYNSASFGLKGLASYNAGGFREAHLDLLDKMSFSSETLSALGSGRIGGGQSSQCGFSNQGVL